MHYYSEKLRQIFTINYKLLYKVLIDRKPVLTPSKAFSKGDAKKFLLNLESFSAIS